MDKINKIKVRKWLKCILLGLALILIGGIVYKNIYRAKETALYTKKMELMQTETLKRIEESQSKKVTNRDDKGISAEISPTQGIKVIIDDDTSWSATLQILVILVGTYGGIKVINKYTRA